MSFAVLPGGDPFTTPPRANQTLVGRPLLDTPARKAAKAARAGIQRQQERTIIEIDRATREARRKRNRSEIAALKAKGEAQSARLEQIRNRARDRRRRYNLPDREFGNISAIAPGSDSVYSVDMNQTIADLQGLYDASRTSHTARTPRRGLAGRNHEAANDAALSANVGARRAAGVQQGDAVSLQDVAGTIRAMLGMNRPPPDTRSQPGPNYADFSRTPASTSTSTGSQAAPSTASTGSQATPPTATTGSQADSDASVASRLELASALRKDPSVLKLIEKKVLQWDDLLAADGGVSFEKVQRVRMKLQEQEELAGETYAEAQRYHQIDPITGTRPEVIRGLNPTIAGNRQVAGTKYVMYSGPRYADQ
jgi:hypothetical protein